MNILKLSEMIYTRISHDISSPVGALHNGAELLQEDLSFVQETSEMILQSTTSLMSRLRFFRQTFGLSKNAETDDITDQYLATFSMPFTLEQECVFAWQRALIMALTDLFYKGAHFEVKNDCIVARGPICKDPSALISVLVQGQGEETANNAPLWFVYHTLKENNQSCQIQHEDGFLQIQIIS